MADTTEFENRDSLEQQIYIALGKDDSTPLRDLLRATTQVAIAELKTQLHAGAQAALVTLHRYCNRWDAKITTQPPATMGDPVRDEPYNAMPEFDREQRDSRAFHPLDEFDLAWRPHRHEPVPLPPLAPPPAWDSKPVQEMRGTLRGALKQLMATGHGMANAAIALNSTATNSNAEKDDFVSAMARYSHSFDEMRTVRLNPRKAIPLDQYPDETQIGVGVITRGKNMKKYVRYLHGVTARNERIAAQARNWWSWWEKAQVTPHQAGPSPLVPPEIEAALRTAAARRSAENPVVAPAITKDSTESPAQLRLGNTAKYKRIQSTIDDAGHKALCTAWDGQDPHARRRPTWSALANAVHRELELEGSVLSTLTALKQRSPRTRDKWDAIGREMAEERESRRPRRK